MGQRSLTLTKTSCTCIGILFGLPVGSIVTLFFVGMAQRSVENPRIMTFGDVTMVATAYPDAPHGYAEQLVMTKDGRSFLSIMRNKAGKVTDLLLADGEDHIILTLEASQERGKWMSAKYGPSTAGVLNGDTYIDINFDGRFDTKIFFDHAGKLRGRYINRYRTWEEVDRIQDRKAFSGSDTFTFDEDFGWRLDKTGSDATTENVIDR